MGVSHSMDREQVDEVLTEFEATTSSITGIEKKMEKVSQYMETVQVQRRALVVHAEVTTSLIDGLGESMADQSKLLYDYFATSFEHFAGLVEVLETSLYNLKLEDAPRQIQREFGPLLMPSVVLVFIITVSNCYFGFLLAGDENLSTALGDGMFNTRNASNTTGEFEGGYHSEMNILFLFAVSHVVLIGLALVYIVVDLLRRWLRTGRRRSVSRISLSGPFLSSEDEESAESEAGSASENEAGGEGTPTSLSAERNGGERPSTRSSLSRLPRLSRRPSAVEPAVSRRSSTPVSGLLRRVQQVALGRESKGSNDSEVKIIGNMFRLPSVSGSPPAQRSTQEWVGLCRIKDTQVAVRVAATSTSTVICMLAHGKRIMVQQAIRGGKGKIWGRLSHPVAGWVLLADQTQGYRAVSKIQNVPSPVQEGPVSRNSRSSGETSGSKTLSSALRSMGSNLSQGSRERQMERSISPRGPNDLSLL